jgi:hypothetical protein
MMSVSGPSSGGSTGLRGRDGLGEPDQRDVRRYRSQGDVIGRMADEGVLLRHVDPGRSRGVEGRIKSNTEEGGLPARAIALRIAVRGGREEIGGDQGAEAEDDGPIGISEMDDQTPALGCWVPSGEPR